MDLKQSLILGSFCVVILVPLSLSENFELSSSPSVIGTVGQDVILPCQISLGRQPQNMEVQWQKIGDQINICQFKASSGLVMFGQGYETRTVLAKEGMPNGNVSLKLKNVQVTDEGTYRCIVKSKDWSDNTRTDLHVTGMGMVFFEVFGPDGEGIKLACRSSGWYPSPELQWLVKDSQSQPFELQQNQEKLFSVFSSITVLRDTKEVTCLVQETSRVQLEQKSTNFLSNGIFPQTSPWNPAFWVFFILSFLVFGVLGYYMYKERKKKRTEKKEKLIQENEKSTLESENGQLRASIERARTELDFRKAQSYLVQVHLDSSCKHPELEVHRNCQEVRHLPTSSEAATMPGALIVVGTEGFAKGRQYWQVVVGNKPDWELGVLTEATRASLKKKSFDAPLKEGYWSLGQLNGKYHLEEANCKISGHTVKPVVIGIFLDWEEPSVSFYSVNSMTAIVKIPIQTSEKLYPFFNPGHSEVGDMGKKPLIIYHNSDWDSTLQLAQQNFPLCFTNDEHQEPRISENSQESRQTENSQDKNNQKGKKTKKGRKGKKNIFSFSKPPFIKTTKKSDTTPHPQKQPPAGSPHCSGKRGFCKGEAVLAGGGGEQTRLGTRGADRGDKGQFEKEQV